jgi:hypothetical protein
LTVLIKRRHGQAEGLQARVAAAQLRKRSCIKPRLGTVPGQV